MDHFPMDCRMAQERLLSEVSTAQEQLPVGELADHVDHCEACTRLLRELAELERSWRAIRLPQVLEGPLDYNERHHARKMID